MPTPTTDSRQTDSYLDTMLTYAGCSTIPVGRCHTGPGGSLPRQAFAATSHIITAPHVDMTTLLAQVRKAQGSGLQEAGISIDALGGAVDDVGGTGSRLRPPGRADHRAVHRDVHLGAGHPRDQLRARLPRRDDADVGLGRLRQLRRRLALHYQADYFGRNAHRLAQARATYDPHHFFTQPQDF